MIVDKTTHTYKVVDDCEIKADIYPQADTSPGIVWLHGGALIGGHRGGISNDELDAYISQGYTVISIDYRLAPETKLKEIIGDVEDAFKWIRRGGPEMSSIDRDRVAVIGHSAGGYLALTTGFRVLPHPKALVSFYGYGDITGEWYSRPDPFYCRQPEVSREEAYGAVGEKPISEAFGLGDRGRYYLYLRQKGLWPKEVAGLDPVKNLEAFNEFSPICNITKDYPPTLLLHGEEDTDVPCEQSVMMAHELERMNVAHDLLTIPGAGHGFDRNGRKDPRVAEVFGRVVEFLERHV